MSGHTVTEWDHDVGDIACPRCGESIGNPYERCEEIMDEAEEYTECEHCEVGMWVVASYRPQFRFTAHAEEPLPEPPIIEGARGLDAPGGTEP